MGLTQGTEYGSIGLECHAIYSDNFFEFVNMDLVINKELVMFDVETTGLSISKDFIIQITMIKFFPGKQGAKTAPAPVVKTRLINPTPEGIELMKKPNTAPHNIKWQDLVKEPTFKQIAKGMRQFLGNADLGGHNIRRFDIPMLREHFMRCGIIDWPGPNVRLVDTLALFQKLVPRNLVGAVAFFTSEQMNENAHDSEYDTRMTIKVLDGMLKWAPNLGHTTEELHQYSKPDVQGVDWNGHLILDSKSEIVFAKGRHKGAPIIDHPGYCKWMLVNDFPQDTKEAILNTYRLHKRKLP